MSGVTFQWEFIRDTLGQEIAAGTPPVGERLPTEAALAQRFGVNRHTVRRGLAALRACGIVQSRQGSGVHVLHKPAVYRIGRRTRFSESLSAANSRIGMEIIELRTREANPDEERWLRLGAAAGIKIHDVLGTRQLDGNPVGLFHSIFPARRFPDLPEQLRRTKKVTKALRKCGIADYTRRTTSVHAKAATHAEASRLRCRVGEALLHVQCINVDRKGTPIELGSTWFRGDAIRLVLDHEDRIG